ncbi:MAG: aminopeptidase [Anaerolineae bacterium]|nr:aminopeptidase [Anaerolineae bacterium]
MQTSQTFAQKLQNYADLIVKVGLGLQAGQRLLVRAPVEAAPLVRLIAASAYQAGARLVDVMWSDDALTLARFKYAPRDSFAEYPAWRTEAMTGFAEQGDAALSIHVVDPDLLKDQDPELVSLAQRVHDEHLLPFRRRLMADESNWCLVSMPIPAWAAKIFPHDPPDKQLAQLWDVIFKVCRLDRLDPLAAWQEHLAILQKTADYLNTKQYAVLKYTAPGTNFTVGLPQNHIWKSGQSQSQNGISFVCNLPTEEVFTMPHKDTANGVVASTKPLNYNGVLIEDFSLTFAHGRVVGAAAKKGETALKKMINSDEGAAKLGEVALAPQSSPVAQAGILFYHTLYDENAANHLALGRAYRFCLQHGPTMSDEQFAAAGGNNSLIHTDFMIGSAEMDVDGLTRDGAVEPVMRRGEWAF